MNAGFEVAYKPLETISFSERLAGKQIKHNPAQLRALASTNLMRSYPAARRLQSSNFAPHDFWAAGLQMVALNLQTYGKEPVESLL